NYATMVGRGSDEVARYRNWWPWLALPLRTQNFYSRHRFTLRRRSPRISVSLERKLLQEETEHLTRRLKMLPQPIFPPTRTFLFLAFSYHGESESCPGVSEVQVLGYTCMVLRAPRGFAILRLLVSPGWLARRQVPLRPSKRKVSWGLKSSIFATLSCLRSRNCWRQNRGPGTKSFTGISLPRLA